MDWDIPRYWGTDGDIHSSDEDGPPSPDDIELGDSFQIHFVDDDGVEHWKWVHGGWDLSHYDDLDDAIYDIIEQLYTQGSL